LENIRLRGIEASDIDFVRASSEDPFIPEISTVPALWSVAAGREFIERQYQRLPEGSGYPLVLETLTTPGAVGFIGVWFRELAQGHLTFGYWTIPAARRSGYMTEALRGLSDWAFAHIDCDRHRLYIEEWNVASRKTGERAGFVHQRGLSGEEDVGGELRQLLVWERARAD